MKTYFSNIYILTILSVISMIGCIPFASSTEHSQYKLASAEIDSTKKVISDSEIGSQLQVILESIRVERVIDVRPAPKIEPLTAVKTRSNNLNKYVEIEDSTNQGGEYVRINFLTSTTILEEVEIPIARAPFRMLSHEDIPPLRLPSSTPRHDLDIDSSAVSARKQQTALESLAKELTPLKYDGGKRQKVAFITGISRGIGKELAKMLLGQGIHVIGLARNADLLNQFVKEHHERRKLAEEGRAAPLGELRTFATDLSTEEGQNIVGLILKDLLEEGVVIDYLILNAAVITPLGPKAIFKASCEDIRRSLRTNIEANIIVTGIMDKFLNLDNEGSRVLFVSSIAGTRPGGGTSLYSISKAAGEQFMRAMRRDDPFAGKVIFASVNPGNVETEIHSKDLRGGGLQGEDLKKFHEDFPRVEFFRSMEGRLTNVDVAADFISWLLTKASKEEFLKYEKHEIYNVEQQKLWSPGRLVLDPYPSTASTIPTSPTTYLASPSSSTSLSTPSCHSDISSPLSASSGPTSPMATRPVLSTANVESSKVSQSSALAEEVSRHEPDASVLNVLNNDGCRKANA